MNEAISAGMAIPLLCSSELLRPLYNNQICMVTSNN